MSAKTRLLLPGLLGVVLGGRAAGQNTGTTAPAGDKSIDLTTGTVHSLRLKSGVPLGGIGAGTFQLMTDGSVSRATLTNDGSRPTGDLPGCFAAVWTRVGDRTTARVLALHNAYGLPCVPALDYDGLYPQATLTFPNASLPLAVSLQGFSPLIPFDIKNSSFPAAAFVFHLKNTSPVPVEVSVALSWENMLGAGEPEQGATHSRTGGTVVTIPDSEGYFGLRFPSPSSAAATGSDPRRANGTGEMALLARPPRAQATATTAGWNATDPRPIWWDAFAAEGSVSGMAPRAPERATLPAGVVAVRLTLKPQDSVDIPFAVAWYLPHALTRSGEDYGHYYQIAFPDAPGAARSLLQDWRSLLALTEEWQDDLSFSNAPRWLVRRFINSAAPLTANSVHARDGRFAFVDDADGIVAGESEPLSRSGNLETLSERLSVHTLLLAFFPDLDAQELSQFAASQSSEGAIPPRLGNVETSLGPAGATEREGKGEKGKSDKEGRGGPGPGNGDQDTGAIQNPKPKIENLPASGSEEIEAVSAFALQTAQYALWTGDRAFLQSYFPNVRHGLELYLHNLDPDSLPNPANVALLGPHEAGPPVPDGSELSPRTAILWLAALRAGQRLAEIAGSPDFARQCADGLARGKAGVRRRFWNGQFYAGTTPEGGVAPARPDDRKGRPDDLCAADQLLGQWAVEELGLADILPANDLAHALQSLQTRNDRASGFAFGPPALLRADGTPPIGDARSRDCLLPASLLAEATLFIFQGQPDAGVALLQRLDHTRDNVLGLPWQSPLRFRADTGQAETPGARDLAQAADWNALYALEGFRLDIGAGRLALAPRIPGTWRSFTAPVFGPTFWGHVEFKPTVHGGVLTFRLDRLMAVGAATPSHRPDRPAGLALTSLRVPGPPQGRSGWEVHVSVGQSPVDSHAILDRSGDIVVTFDAPLTLAPGDHLEVDVH